MADDDSIRQNFWYAIEGKHLKFTPRKFKTQKIPQKGGFFVLSIAELKSNNGFSTSDLGANSNSIFYRIDEDFAISNISFRGII